MFTSNAKSITPVAVSILLAGAAVLLSSVVLAALLSSVAPEAKAASDVTRTIHLSYAKGNRLPPSDRGTACSWFGWPHYEQACLFDRRRPADEPRRVRVIASR